jgi:hypothetical protein
MSSINPVELGKSWDDLAIPVLWIAHRGGEHR